MGHGYCDFHLMSVDLTLAMLNLILVLMGRHRIRAIFLQMGFMHDYCLVPSPMLDNSNLVFSVLQFNLNRRWVVGGINLDRAHS